MPRGLNLHIFGIRSIYRFGMMTLRNQYTSWHAENQGLKLLRLRSSKLSDFFFFFNSILTFEKESDLKIANVSIEIVRE